MLPLLTYDANMLLLGLFDRLINWFGFYTCILSTTFQSSKHHRKDWELYMSGHHPRGFQQRGHIPYPFYPIAYADTALRHGLCIESGGMATLFDWLIDSGFTSAYFRQLFSDSNAAFYHIWVKEIDNKTFNPRNKLWSNILENENNSFEQSSL